METVLIILLEFVIILLAALVTIALIKKPNPDKKDTQEPPPVYIPVPEKESIQQFDEDQVKAVQDVARSLQVWNEVFNDEDK